MRPRLGINRTHIKQCFRFGWRQPDLSSSSSTPSTPLNPIGQTFCQGRCEQSEMYAQYGCPYRTLGSELAKRSQSSDSCAAELLQAPIDWAEMQFRAMGCLDAHALAIELIAAYQGTAVLTNV